jgi:pyruvate formate lyase activating enzyme
VIEEVALQRSLDEKVYLIKSAVGSWQSAGEVMTEIEKDIVFYRESGGGVTFSGGEPLMQADFLAEMLKKCRKAGLHTVVDTCGHAEPAALAKCIDLADLWLFDLKIMDDLQHLEYTGVSNEILLKNLESLCKAGNRVVIRFPVIPGITDMLTNMEAIAVKMIQLGLNTISILPYHAIAKDKYRRMEKEFMMEEVAEPDEEKMRMIREFFTGKGLEIYR